MDKAPLDLAGANQYILELEAQIRSLTAKMTAAVDHAADLEDELRTLKMNHSASTNIEESHLRRVSTYFSRRTPNQGSHNRSQMTSSTSSSNLTTIGPNSQRDQPDLVEELAKERKLRIEAEENYHKVQREMEQVSEELFHEANQMVAVERIARYAAEQKTQTWKERETEKVKRLDAIEQAIERINRVRGFITITPLPHHHAAKAAA